MNLSFPAQSVIKQFTSAVLIQYPARPGQARPGLQGIQRVQRRIRGHAVRTSAVPKRTGFYSIHHEHRGARLCKYSLFASAAVPQVWLLHNNQRDLLCHHPHRLHRGGPGLCAPGSRLPTNGGHIRPVSLPLSQLPCRHVRPGPGNAALCHGRPLLLSPGAGGCHRGQREAQEKDGRSQDS